MFIYLEDMIWASLATFLLVFTMSTVCQLTSGTRLNKTFFLNWPFMVVCGYQHVTGITLTKTWTFFSLLLSAIMIVFVLIPKIFQPLVWLGANKQGLESTEENIENQSQIIHQTNPNPQSPVGGKETKIFKDHDDKKMHDKSQITENNSKILNLLTSLDQIVKIHDSSDLLLFEANDKERENVNLPFLLKCSPCHKREMLNLRANEELLIYKELTNSKEIKRQHVRVSQHRDISKKLLEWWGWSVNHIKKLYESEDGTDKSFNTSKASSEENSDNSNTECLEEWWKNIKDTSLEWENESCKEELTSQDKESNCSSIDSILQELDKLIKECIEIENKYSTNIKQIQEKNYNLNAECPEECIERWINVNDTSQSIEWNESFTEELNSSQEKQVNYIDIDVIFQELENFKKENLDVENKNNTSLPTSTLIQETLCNNGECVLSSTFDNDDAEWEDLDTEDEREKLYSCYPYDTSSCSADTGSEDNNWGSSYFEENSLCF